MAQIVPPQRQDVLQQGISADSGMSAYQSQAQAGAQLSQTAGIIAQSAMQQSRQNEEYFKSLQQSIGDAEYSKVFSQAILEFNSAVNDRQSKVLDDKGNPTFATLSQDIGKIGNDIYNKYAKQASPLIAGRFKQSLNNTITNRQAESFAESRKQANQWMLGQAENSYNTLSKAAIEGSPSISAESKLEFENQLKGYVANGVISPVAASDMIANFNSTVGQVRGQNLIMANPEAVMLGTAPGTDDSFLNQNGIYLDPVKKQQLNLKAQQEVARRSQEAIAAQDAAITSIKDTYSEMNKVIENGGRLDPAAIDNLKGQISKLSSPKASPLKADIELLANKAHAITQFSTLDPVQRQAVLSEYEASGNLGTAYETLKRTNDNINNNLKKDPYAFAISQNTVQNYQPLDLSGDIQAQLAKRRQDIAQISSRFGVESSGFTNQEIDAISKHINNLAPDQEAKFFGDIVGGMGQKSVNLFKALAKNGDRQNALIGAMVMSGREDTASKVLQGFAAIKQNKNLSLDIKSKDVQDNIQSILKAMPDSANSAYTDDTLSIARAIYAQKSMQDKDFSGEFKLDRFKESVKEAQGGEQVRVLGHSTLGIFKSSQSNIVAPTKDMTADGFENWIHSLKDSDIQGLGGWKGFNSGMAQQLQNAKLQQYGPGSYIVMLPSKLSDTGFTPVLNAKTGAPFVLDYNQIQDNKTLGAKQTPVSTNKAKGFDSKAFVKMIDFSVTGQDSNEDVGNTVGISSDVSGFIKNAVSASSTKLAPYDNHISNSAAVNNINENLIRAIILTESSGNAGAVSNKGAKGLMQITEGAAKDVGMNMSTVPGNNIEIGSRYISLLLKKYKGNLDLALAAYNAGMGKVNNKVPNIKETKEYVQKVKGIFGRLQQGRK